jgi:hypothetical protein
VSDGNTPVPEAQFSVTWSCHTRLILSNELSESSPNNRMTMTALRKYTGTTERKCSDPAMSQSRSEMPAIDRR